MPERRANPAGATNDYRDSNKGGCDMNDRIDIRFPFHFDARGRTALAGYDQHIRDMIEQFIFTSAGERVNRPDFGSGLLQMVFDPNSLELAAALQFTIQAGLQRWLGDVIEVTAVEVTSEDSTIRVFIQYVVLRTNEAQEVTLERAVQS
jgi:phage baseplate assembly protein W